MAPQVCVFGLLALKIGRGIIEFEDLIYFLMLIQATCLSPSQSIHYE